FRTTSSNGVFSAKLVAPAGGGTGSRAVEMIVPVVTIVGAVFHLDLVGRIDATGTDQDCPAEVVLAAAVDPDERFVARTGLCVLRKLQAQLHPAPAHRAERQHGRLH